jgi:hypothetical protein
MQVRRLSQGMVGMTGLLRRWQIPACCDIRSGASAWLQRLLRIPCGNTSPPWGRGRACGGRRTCEGSPERSPSGAGLRLCMLELAVLSRPPYLPSIGPVLPPTGWTTPGPGPRGPPSQPNLLRFAPACWARDESPCAPRMRCRVLICLPVYPTSNPVPQPASHSYAASHIAASHGVVSRGDYVAAGAGYLGRSAGKWYFEVEALQAEGIARVGVAGTNFRETALGEGKEASWAVNSRGFIVHRHAPDCAASRRRSRARPWPHAWLLPEHVEASRPRGAAGKIGSVAPRAPCVLTCSGEPLILRVRGSGQGGANVAPGWFTGGGVLGVAVDLDAGALLCTTGAHRQCASSRAPLALRLTDERGCCAPQGARPAGPRASPRASARAPPSAGPCSPP